MQPYFIQLFDLFLIQLTNWRWSWFSTILYGTISPMLLVFLLGVFAPEDDLVARSYILTGNIVVALLLDGLTKTATHFVYMRTSGTLDYYATLPIQRSALIISTVLAFFLMSIPSVVLTLIAGTIILQIPLSISPMILIVIPVTVLSLAGLGAVIGLLGKDPNQVYSISTLITLVFFGFGPVMIPADKLPQIVNQLSLLSPATYAASAFRQAVLNSPEQIPLIVDLVVLSVFSIVCVYIVSQRLDWRGKS